MSAANGGPLSAAVLSAVSWPGRRSARRIITPAATTILSRRRPALCREGRKAEQLRAQCTRPQGLDFCSVSRTTSRLPGEHSEIPRLGPAPELPELCARSADALVRTGEVEPRPEGPCAQPSASTTLARHVLALFAASAFRRTRSTARRQGHRRRDRGPSPPARVCRHARPSWPIAAAPRDWGCNATARVRAPPRAIARSPFPLGSGGPASCHHYRHRNRPSCSVRARDPTRGRSCRAERRNPLYRGV